MYLFVKYSSKYSTDLDLTLNSVQYYKPTTPTILNSYTYDKAELLQVYINNIIILLNKYKYDVTPKSQVKKRTQ